MSNHSIDTAEAPAMLRSYAVQIVANTPLGHPSYEGREVPPLINYGTISASGTNPIDAAVMAFQKLLWPFLEFYLYSVEDPQAAEQYWDACAEAAMAAGLQETTDHPFAGSVDVVLIYRIQNHEFYFRVLTLSFATHAALREAGRKILAERCTTDE